MRPIEPDRAVSDFGRRVGEERELHGWTQAEFAEHVGVSLRYVQHIEQGSQNVTITSAVRFANALKVPLAKLFEAPRTRPAGRGRPPKTRRTP